MTRIAIVLVGLVALVLGVWFVAVDRALMGGACIALGVACLGTSLRSAASRSSPRKQAPESIDPSRSRP